jgi:hypothetical protein
MRTVLVLAGLTVLATANFAEARRGGFLSALIRGGAHAAANHGTSAAIGSTRYIKSYGPDTLTVAELEACIKRATELDKSASLVDAVSDKLATESSAIDRAQADLAATKNLVNRYSEASVNAYNNKLDALSARINVHNNNVRQAKLEQMTHNLSVSLYNNNCAKRYYADDMQAAKLRLGVVDPQ